MEARYIWTGEPVELDCGAKILTGDILVVRPDDPEITFLQNRLLDACSDAAAVLLDPRAELIYVQALRDGPLSRFLPHDPRLRAIAAARIRMLAGRARPRPGAPGR